MSDHQFVVKPIPGKKFTMEQNPYKWAPVCPFRQILYANTNSGKTTLILSQCLDLYRDVFERIFVFSHSWETDQSWAPLKEYMEAREWNVRECGFTQYSDEALGNIIRTPSSEIEICVYLKE